MKDEDIGFSISGWIRMRICERSCQIVNEATRARLLTRCPGSRSCSWPGTCVDRAATERRATENVYWPSVAWRETGGGEEIGCRQAFKG